MNPADDLRDLPSTEPPHALDDRVRRVAHAELAVAIGPRWRVIAVRAWTRVALPAAIAVTVVGYLHWAMEASSALFR